MNLLATAIWVAVITSTVLLFRGLNRSRPAPGGPEPRLHDLSEAAFLAGGPGAVVDAALVSMLGDGRLVVGGPGIVRVSPGARAGDFAERAVLQAHANAPSGWLYQVRYGAMLDPAIQETGDALAARGLISPPGAGRRWRRWGVTQAVVCGVLLPFSLVLTFVGLAVDSGSQVPFIVKVFPVLIGGVVMGCAAVARAGRRLTPAGRTALRAMRSAYLYDRTPHVQTALLGLAGLRDPYLRALLVPAARSTRLAAAQSGSRSSWSGAEVLPVVWCASGDGGSGGGSSGCGGGSGVSGCASSGSSCGSSSSSCASSGGSSCSSSSSSCSSSSGSSCSSSS
ncbi:TIGR04222 domain-containing membrane protein [Streptomyces sp. APSN-46.1]|uniref:TIGR04222 domain-containing membrane protein n=1 Tax=Streptomyces sp. APSN-46.1 TaxID=2929049 RepID=UPI001FB1BA5B|nr:TIGR04222 domain-containing membrane protein [Streptomyces sp. APSN-46.1]MCJ1680521.1 TIGR04222 domain-containing membrane protein [Streptomyces sp. APSN-46.1]